MRKTSLFELLGHPAAAAPLETCTNLTLTPETYDDAGVLPSIADGGTAFTRSSAETYDDDALLPSM